MLLKRKAVEAKKISPWCAMPGRPSVCVCGSHVCVCVCVERVAPDHMGHVRTQFTDLMRHTMHTKGKAASSSARQSIHQSIHVCVCVCIATTPISALVAWQRKPLLKMLSIHRKKAGVSSHTHRRTNEPIHPSIHVCVCVCVWCRKIGTTRRASTGSPCRQRTCGGRSTPP